MKVILKQDIPNLGDAGDIKDVSPGYARNYLIPKKLVIPYDESSRKALEHQKRIIETKKQKRKKQVQEVIKVLEELKELEIPMRVGANKKLFGSVTPVIVSKAIEEKTGLVIDKRKIIIQDPIKQLGEFRIKLQLAEDTVIPFPVKVVPFGETKKEESAQNTEQKQQENIQENPEQS